MILPILRSLEVNDIAIKCGLLAVLVKLKGSIFFNPSRKSDLLFPGYSKLGLKCDHS